MKLEVKGLKAVLAVVLALLLPLDTSSESSGDGIRLAVAPDASYGLVAEAIREARESLVLGAYLFTQPDLALALADKARSGVEVDLLLEGRPWGGIPELQRACCREMAQAGVRVSFRLQGDRWGRSRFHPFHHPKYLVADERLLIVGTENFGRSGCPSDLRDNGTAGNRGFYLEVTDPPAVAAVLAMARADRVPGDRAWVLPWSLADPVRGLPRDWSLPRLRLDPGGYHPIAPEPRWAPAAPIRVVAGPEDALDAVLDLIRSARSGDELLVMQAYEQPIWGRSDPSPRLQALLQASQRGVRVRLLLSGRFGNPEGERSNRAVTRLAWENRHRYPNFWARRATPARGPIHAKVLALRSPGGSRLHVGSINGSAPANLWNRELALEVDSEELVEEFTRVFEHDWGRAYW